MDPDDGDPVDPDDDADDNGAGDPVDGDGPDGDTDTGGDPDGPGDADGSNPDGGGDPVGGGDYEVVIGSLVEAGTGFSGPTPQPSALGVPGELGFEQTAIARWASVPLVGYVDGLISFYVAADHIRDMSHVDFCLDGGPWVRVDEPTFVEELDCDAYVISVDVDELERGSHELRAIATPLVGASRVLQGEMSHAFDGLHESSVLRGMHSMLFSAITPEDRHVVWVSNDGSDDTGTGSEQAPFRSISHAAWIGIAGATVGADLSFSEVRLKPGIYSVDGFSWPRSSVSSDDGWFRIVGDDSDDPPVITGSGGIQVHNFGLENCIIDLDDMDSGNILYGRVQSRLWYDRCVLKGRFNTDGNFTTGWTGGLWATDCRAIDVFDSPFQQSSLAVNCHIDGCLVDAFRSRGMFNCSVRRQDPSQKPELHDPHPDVYQVFYANGEVDNIIIWGLDATDSVYAQGLFFSGHTTVFKNLSIRNTRVDNTFNGERTGFNNLSAVRPFEHVLLKDCEFTGGFFYASGTPYTSNGVFSASTSVMRNCLEMDGGAPVMPFPDGPGAGGAWSGAWNGQMPWVSNLTGMIYESD